MSSERWGRPRACVAKDSQLEDEASLADKDWTNVPSLSWSYLISNIAGLVGMSREEKGACSSRKLSIGSRTLSITGRTFAFFSGLPSPVVFVVFLRFGENPSRRELVVAGLGCSARCVVRCAWVDVLGVCCLLLVGVEGANVCPPQAEIPTTFRLISGGPSSRLRAHHADAGTQQPSIRAMRLLLMAGPY